MSAVELPMSPEQIGLSFGPYKDDPDGMERTILLPRGFPYFELKNLGEMLEENGVFVPGYIPPPVGLCVPDSFIFENQFEGINTILLPDRNIVSRMAKIATGAPMDAMLRKVTAIKAFCHYLDIQIEPSIAFHEQAQSQGNARANEELAWFRAADNTDPHPWLELAFGIKDRLDPTLPLREPESLDLAFPLRRWRRNYIAALKIAEIELTGGPNIERLFNLFNWMRNDFMVAGPAALMACIYYAPNSPPRAGLFKGLRSPDRARAIYGVRNAAWDLTHLSDFIHRVNEAEGSSNRLLFASFDEGLRNLARLLLASSSDGLDPGQISDAISAWWPPQHSIRIGEAFAALLSCINGQDRKHRQSRSPVAIDEMIARGEASVTAFTGVDTSICN